MMTLAIFVLIDYITGVVLAAVFKKTNKSTNGKLDSRAGLKGLCRKGEIFLLVIVAQRLDDLCGMGGVLRTGVIFALVANEAISIIENLGLMGLPLPAVLVKAIDQLHDKCPEDKKE
ncbi:MAG: phage holin family protein [Ruminococcaceae bacterium]|nr:phage holin family protein [Oscillospiraceae bacterium]